MHFGVKLPEIGENRPDFGMPPTYGSDSKLDFVQNEEVSRDITPVL